MIIEQAKVSDAYKSEAEIYNDFNIAPLIQTLEEIKRDFRNQVFLKTVIQGKMIGSVRAMLIVHPDFQNRGIGTKI
jgi:hypothetical protein